MWPWAAIRTLQEQVRRIMGKQADQAALLQQLVADLAATKTQLDTVTAAQAVTATSLAKINQNATVLQGEITKLQSGQSVDLTAALAAANAIMTESSSVASTEQANLTAAQDDVTGTADPEAAAPAAPATPAAPPASS